jgi:hypothetical protein
MLKYILCFSILITITSYSYSVDFKKPETKKQSEQYSNGIVKNLEVKLVFTVDGNAALLQCNIASAAAKIACSGPVLAAYKISYVACNLTFWTRNKCIKSISKIRDNAINACSCS